MKKRIRVLVALSGGVDSAVAAAILKDQGYDVTGVYIRTWQNEQDIFAPCPWENDLKAAKAVAQKLEINFIILNAIELYKKNVAQYLIDGYKNGMTPNPDVMCNRFVKFGFLKDYAKENNYDLLATGHYCFKPNHSSNEIYEGKDEKKDQSYFLALVRNLEKVIFPIGSYKKSEIREIANEKKLPNANRKDSQGICFLGGKMKINEFLKQYIKDNVGEIINSEGKILGKHNGLHHFTLGQRKGIGIPSNSDFNHYVVVEKDYQKNRLVVDFENENTSKLHKKKFAVSGLNFLAERPQNMTCMLARARYRDPSEEIKFVPKDENTAEVTFLNPQRAIAQGQIIAFYKKNRLIGGGIYSKFLD